MGYYSDVTLALTKKGAAALKKRLSDSSIPENARKETKDLLENSSKHVRDERTGTEIWHWESIKWYACDPQHFPEVDFLESFLTELEEKDYRFMRIGESYDDVEVYGNFLDDPFGLRLYRQIGMNF